ncbi:PTK6 kinase, partial [Amia calva]|nr:PTK6 kinase [Amia calva]
MGETFRNKCPWLCGLCTRLCGHEQTAGDGAGDVDREIKTAKAPLTPEVGRYNAPVPPVPHSEPIYTALWPFQARASEELSFQPGELFTILDHTGEWWTAAKIDPNGRVVAEGYVPRNYLARGDTLEAQPWFVGKMNRLEAVNQVLSTETGDGTFLVRVSERQNIDYVLSVKFENKVRHFQVLQNEDMFYLNDKKSFPTLMDLIDFYRMHSLPHVGKLTHGCSKQEPKPKDLSHSTVDEWELPKEEFTLCELLGTGYFADVYQGMWKNQVKVAIKVLKCNESMDFKEFQMETQILKGLRHKHLISLLAICTSEEPFYIVTELMEKGNLLNFLRGDEGKQLDVVSLLDMASQVADGMSYLESQNKIHRDLAARNVLVGDNLICKVADFGLARIIKEPFYLSNDKKIPYKWCAPEAISHGCFSTKSDVWSFGILLYEILTYGGVPYPGYHNSEMYALVSGEYRLPRPERCPQSAYRIMLACWDKIPDKRPAFRSLMQKLENINKYEIN